MHRDAERISDGVRRAFDDRPRITVVPTHRHFVGDRPVRQLDRTRRATQRSSELDPIRAGGAEVGRFREKSPVWSADGIGGKEGSLPKGGGESHQGRRSGKHRGARHRHPPTTHQTSLLHADAARQGQEVRGRQYGKK